MHRILLLDFDYGGERVRYEWKHTPQRVLSDSNPVLIYSRSMREFKSVVDITGLLGFTLSGILFVISAVRSGDPVALAGSVVWIISCLGWILALLRTRDT